MSGEQVETLYAYETTIEKNNIDQDWDEKKNCSCYSIHPGIVGETESEETTRLNLDTTQNDVFEILELDQTQEEMSCVYEDLETAYETGSVYEPLPSEVDVEVMDGDFNDCGEVESIWNVSKYSPTPSEVDVELL